MKKAFTLIEVLTAIFVFTAGVIGVYALVQRVVSFTSFTSSRLVAIYLAQEGIEKVRNVRDSNWLYQRENPEHPWDDGIENTTNYPLGYQREITIDKSQEDILGVTVSVRWKERGLPREVTVQEKLYNWR